ncbi:unnamed protein product [Ranitomeya imitator]|uniref:Uncharacterized protein n=1 Tax=Ranitomeya imitator TaxID=111125 RepID=A0ABN9L6S2_9NEOB|nr:unnamed protein product [Ranitomeya imitator]
MPHADVRDQSTRRLPATKTLRPTELRRSNQACAPPGAEKSQLPADEMTTTSTIKGLDPESRSSSRVLRPPGGGSSFSFGVEASKQQQPARRHKMASNIFGIPDNEPAPTSCASEPDMTNG